MSKEREKNELKKVTGLGADYLAKYIDDDHSQDGMDEYRVLPRLKILQAMSDNELKKTFGEGSVIIRPGDAEIWHDSDEPFKFVPHFFYVEFAKWSDLNDTDSPMVLASTYDPTSEIAKFSRDPDKRVELYEGDSKRPPSEQRNYRYIEHLRFCGQIYGDHPLAGTSVVISFEKGEFHQGKNFISAIKLRKQKVTVDDQLVSKNVPLWAQVWQFKVGFRDKGKKSWYGLDFSAPKQNLIAESEVADMLAAHKELKEVYNKNLLKVDEEAAGKGEDKKGVAASSKF